MLLASDEEAGKREDGKEEKSPEKKGRQGPSDPACI